MRIHLPNSAFLGNIDSFLRSQDLTEPQQLIITANRKWIAIHPVVLAMVAALGQNAAKTVCEELEAASKHYLERMGLFAFLGIDSGISIVAHEPAGRFIPLTRVEDSEGLTRFLTEMVPLLHLAPAEAEPIRYVVSELIRNVLEHAETDGAIVCAQYYRKSNRIAIGIADTGVGIRQTIRRSHEAPTHLEAIRLALMPGITGTTRQEGGTEYNAGAGLFFIKSLATINRDFFLLYSGDAFYKLLKSGAKTPRLHSDPFEDRHAAKEGLPSWRGTVVGIDLSLDATASFTELLDSIRETYTTTIRERKRQKRRPRFI